MNNSMWNWNYPNNSYQYSPIDINMMKNWDIPKLSSPSGTPDLTGAGGLNLDNIFQGIGKYGSYAKGILDLFNTGRSLLGMGPEDQNRKLVEQMMNWQKQKYEQSYADAQARYNDYMRKQNASKLSFSPTAAI